LSEVLAVQSIEQLERVLELVTPLLHCRVLEVFEGSNRKQVVSLVALPHVDSVVQNQDHADSTRKYSIQGLQVLREQIRGIVPTETSTLEVAALGVQDVGHGTHVDVGPMRVQRQFEVLVGLRQKLVDVRPQLHVVRGTKGVDFVQAVVANGDSWWQGSCALEQRVVHVENQRQLSLVS
jgi:hypothetical protein